MVPNRFAVILGSAILAAVAWTLPAKAQDVEVLPDRSRLVAIGGSITEIVYALGEEETLVARDSTSVYPPEAFSLPDVGYIRQLSPEGVLSVNPSGILALHGAGPREAVDVLRKASVPYVEVPDTFDHAGILVKIRAVGQALGVEEKAERLAREVDANLAAAEKRTAGITDRKQVLFILSMQDGRILASGTETAANGIIAMAGALNAIDGYTGYKQVSEEAIITAAPDVILMMDRAGSLAISDEDLFAHPAIASTPAGATHRVVRMDGAYLLGFGPRTAEAVNDLAVALYGDQVDD